MRDFIARNVSWVAAFAVGLLLIVLVISFSPSAKAADLGGNCCADLEERIAELEGTVVRKGNRKVSVKIEGQINKAVAGYKIGDEQDAKVIENSASESYLKVSVTANIRFGWDAGAVLEIGQGKTGLKVDMLSGLSLATDNNVYTRQSYVFLATPGGKVSIGLQSMATDDLTAISVANTDAAVKRLTLAPIHYLFVTAGPITLLEAELEPFNGQKADAVRYDTPVLFGVAIASAAWDSADDSWDVAIRAGAERDGFRWNAAAGYELDKVDSLIGLQETKTISLNAGLMHIASGLFVQGSAARLEVEGAGEVDAWHLQAGIERRLLEGVGPTTFWVGYSDWADGDLTFYEAGINQNVAAAVDLYISARSYEIGDDDAQSVLGGARLKF